MASRKRFWNKGRRDLVAKAFTTLVQIAVAAMFAGNLLMQLTSPVKAAMIVGVVLLFCSSVAICPKRSDE